MTMDDLATVLEQEISNQYDGDANEIQVQVRSVATLKVPLPFEDPVTKHFKPGDTVIVDAMALSARQSRPQFTEKMIKEVRKTLRFDLNDRVLCYCGPRHLSGHVVGTAVPDEGDLLPYLVKTDAVPGLPSRTISVPSDHDGCCVQEVCFDPASQMDLIKAGAALLPASSKPKLRFAAGDKIVCRIRNNPKDGKEQWVPGEITMLWPKLPGDLSWELGPASGKFPDSVPYRIDLGSGKWLLCHRDDHTLIRREGLEPQTRVRGISKRMELRKNKDGSKERIDHVTERRKRLISTDSSDSSE